MTYRDVAMWEILEVLRRVGRGENKSEVARTTGHRRKTVRRYVRTAVELGWDPGVEEPSEELAAGVYARHRPASERKPGETEARLLEHRDQIKEWLKAGPTEKRGLRLSKVHELLRRRNVQVPYSTLHRFAVKHCGFSDRRRITVRSQAQSQQADDCRSSNASWSFRRRAPAALHQRSAHAERLGGNVCVIP